jgi:hypothetical protein
VCPNRNVNPETEDARYAERIDEKQSARAVVNTPSIVLQFCIIPYQ